MVVIDLVIFSVNYVLYFIADLVSDGWGLCYLGAWKGVCHFILELSFPLNGRN